MISRHTTLSFQSTLLIRGATRRRTLSRARQGHFNPRSSYEERLSIVIPAVLEIGISIHAPHTRSDARQIRDEQSLSNFNPRSSYEERHDDPATGGNVLRDFNPRSSYEERRTRKQYRPFHCNFNPRSSYEERPPVADRCHTGYDSISIHAPHTRSDLMHGSRRRIWIYFNPRSSYEERHMDTLLQLSDALFQSTLLIRGATTICSPDILPLRISIHAPHTRSDLTPEDVKMICRFQSTLLIRGATSPRAAHFRASKFQSTLLIRGATRKVFSSTALASLFQSTLLIRGATVKIARAVHLAIFQSTLLIRGATFANFSGRQV